MPNLNLPICPSCHGTMRFTRRDSLFKCQYCDYICDSAVAKGLYPKPDAPVREEQAITTDSPVFDMFKRQAQTITAPAPVVTAPVVTAPLPVAVAPIKNEPLHPDLMTDTDVPDTDVPDTEVWTPSFNENAIDVNEIFSYHHGSKDEPKSQPPKFKMPVMQPEPMRQTATSEAPTGSSMYFSLRSDK